MTRSLRILLITVSFLVGATALFLWSGMGFPVASPARLASDLTPQGMQILNDFQCHPAETKHVIVRGVEDYFSPAGDEPVTPHPRLLTPRLKSFLLASQYDNSQPDHLIYDYFQAEGRVAKGLFMIRMKAFGVTNNDTLAIGNIENLTKPTRVKDHDYFLTEISSLGSNPNWSRQGNLYSAPFINIYFDGYALPGQTSQNDNNAERHTLLDYVNLEAPQGVIDVTVQDDTSVDFTAIAYCQEPEAGLGLTFTRAASSPEPITGIAVASCDTGAENQYTCNAWVGDTGCDKNIPVLCFWDIDAPVPRSKRRGDDTSGSWSGGILASTPPVKGSQFQTITEANAYCARQFGKGWRVASYHDGSYGKKISGFGALRAKQGRYWIDIKDQPYATCWSR